MLITFTLTIVAYAQEPGAPHEALFPLPLAVAIANESWSEVQRGTLHTRTWMTAHRVIIHFIQSHSKTWMTGQNMASIVSEMIYFLKCIQDWTRLWWTKCRSSYNEKQVGQRGLCRNKERRDKKLTLLPGIVEEQCARPPCALNMNFNQINFKLTKQSFNWRLWWQLWTCALIVPCTLAVPALPRLPWIWGCGVLPRVAFRLSNKRIPHTKQILHITGFTKWGRALLILSHLPTLPHPRRHFVPQVLSIFKRVPGVGRIKWHQIVTGTQYTIPCGVGWR